MNISEEKFEKLKKKRHEEYLEAETNEKETIYIKPRRKI